MLPMPLQQQTCCPCEHDEADQACGSADCESRIHDFREFTLTKEVREIATPDDHFIDTSDLVHHFSKFNRAYTLALDNRGEPPSPFSKNPIRVRFCSFRL